MDQTRLIAELMKQYGMSQDLATRVAANMQKPSGTTRPYQAAVDAATAPQAPITGAMRSAAADIGTQVGYGSPYNFGAQDRNLRRVDPQLADIVAQGQAPVVQQPAAQPEQQAVTQRLNAAQQLQQSLVVNHGLDPNSAAILAAKLLPLDPAHVTSMGPRGRH